MDILKNKKIVDTAQHAAATEKQETVLEKLKYPFGTRIKEFFQGEDEEGNPSCWIVYEKNL